MKEIQIKCQGAATLSIKKLTDFQGGLKKLTKENLEKLKGRILKTGFIAPIFIWQHEKINYILDGHQRIQALLSLENEGYHIPDLPIAYVEADNKNDAKQKLLSITSQYGEFVIETLQEWTEEFDDKLNDTFRFVNEELELSFNIDIEEPKIINLEPYNKIHVLISFKPDEFIKISKQLDEIRQTPGVEYEQQAN